MIRIIKPAILEGTVSIQASKNATLRAFLCASLGHGVSVVRNVGMCTETRRIIDILISLGVTAEYMEDTVLIAGGKEKFELTKNDIDNGGYKYIECDRSAMCFRTFAAYAAVLGVPLDLHLELYFYKFSIDVVESMLDSLDIPYLTDRENARIKIKGQIKNEVLKMSSYDGSQFPSALLECLPILERESKVYLPPSQNQGYIDMSINIMRHFGVEVDYDAESMIYTVPKKTYDNINYQIEGDWSLAAIFMVAGALVGIPEVKIVGMNPVSTQPERDIIKILNLAGARLVSIPGGYSVSASKLHGFDVHVDDTYVLGSIFPLAVKCEGECRISGISGIKGLRYYEPQLLVNLFTSLGVKIDWEDPDVIVIHGLGSHGKISSDEVIICPSVISSFSVSVASLTAAKPIKIDIPESLYDSFPSFFTDLDSLAIR